MRKFKYLILSSIYYCENEFIYNIIFEQEKIKLELTTNYPHGKKYISNSGLRYNSGTDYKYSYSNGMIRIQCEYNLTKVMTILNELNFIIQTDIVNIYINTNKKENSLVIKKILELDWFRFVSFETNCNDIYDLKNLKNIKYIHFNNDFTTYYEQIKLFPQNDINLMLSINKCRNILIKIPKLIKNVDLINNSISIYNMLNFSPYDDKNISDELEMYLVYDKSSYDYLLNLNPNPNPIDFVFIFDENLSLNHLPNTIKKIHLSNPSNLNYLPESLEYLSVNDYYQKINFSNIPVGIKKIKIYLEEIYFYFSSIPDSVETIEITYDTDLISEDSSQLDKIDKLPKNLKKIIINVKGDFDSISKNLINNEILDKFYKIKEETDSDYKIEFKMFN